MGRVGGDHRVLQVHGLQQLPDLGDLGGVIRDPVLGDDHLLLVQHRGEQLDLAVQDAAQPLAVDGDRGQQPVQPPGIRQLAQPAADDLVQEVRADRVDQGADPRLAWGDDPPQQRVRPPAQPGEHLLWQVSGGVAGLTEAPGAGQRARHGHRQDEGEHEAAPAPPARVRDPRQHLQQAWNLPGCAFIGAGHRRIGSMRDWHGGLSFRADLDSTPVIKPDGRPLPRIAAPR